MNGRVDGRIRVRLPDSAPKPFAGGRLKAHRLTPLYDNRVLTKETIGRRIENVYVSLARSEVVVLGDVYIKQISSPIYLGKW